MKENVLKEKSFAFALKIIDTYKQLTSQKREFVLAKQMLRSGTSIGANIEEADTAQSKRDFLSKVSISYKEAGETKYWLRLLKDSQYLDQDRAIALIQNVDELIKIMTTIIKTTKENLRNEK